METIQAISIEDLIKICIENKFFDYYLYTKLKLMDNIYVFYCTGVWRVQESDLEKIEKEFFEHLIDFATKELNVVRMHSFVSEAVSDSIYEIIINHKITLNLSENEKKLVLSIFDTLVYQYNILDICFVSELLSEKIKMLNEIFTNKDIQFEKHEGITSCNICFEESSQIIVTNCKHLFCENCIRKWIEQKTSCPFCRSSLKTVKS